MRAKSHVLAPHQKKRTEIGYDCLLRRALRTKKNLKEYKCIFTHLSRKTKNKNKEHNKHGTSREKTLFKEKKEQKRRENGTQKKIIEERESLFCYFDKKKRHSFLGGSASLAK